MRTILTTTGMPAKQAFEYWMDVVGRMFRHQSEPVDRHHFYAELNVGALADLAVWAWRLAPRIGRYDDDQDLLLMHPLSRMTFETDGRSFVSGDHLYLLDTRQPTVIRATEPVVCRSLRIPRIALEQRLPLTRKTVNQPIPIQGDAALLANFLSAIVRIGPSSLSLAAKMIAREHALDLCALMLSHLAGRRPELASPTRIATLKLRTAIESQLTDANADRHSIATAAGMSERHANRLLAQEGTSIRRLLIERRLAKCREALEKTERSVSEIAYAFGFRQPNHFTRAFKDYYGISPTEYRAIGARYA
jgi:AraC-like DNA-binding protein